MQPVVARAPGKLVVAGEYAVLEQGHRAVACAVRRHVTVLVQPSARRTVRLDDQIVPWRLQGSGMRIDGDGAVLRLIEAAISTAIETVRMEGVALPPFSLLVRSGLRDVSGRKLGLGSSAATVVAVAAAVLHAARGAPPEPDQLFRIAAAAHHAVQRSGSGVDVAAAVYGGWIAYRGFGEAWLAAQLGAGRSPAIVAAAPWPMVEISRLPQPPLPLAVGWTGHPASTRRRLSQLKRLTAGHEAAYRSFLQESEQAVDAVCEAIRAGCREDLALALRRGRAALALLSARLGYPIETEALRALADAAERLGGGGKVSGAGGGDCGIAFVPARRRVALTRLWDGAGIVSVPLVCGAGGVKTRMLPAGRIVTTRTGFGGGAADDRR